MAISSATTGPGTPAAVIAGGGLLPGAPGAVPGAPGAVPGAPGAVPGARSGSGPGGVPGGEPALRIQLSALQALCRQVFGFRLAMIVLTTPFALNGTEPGWPTWLVGAAIVFTFMGSYLLFRDWERFGPLLLRHPALLGADAAFGALLLFTASPASPLSYVTICTPLLAGLVYGWRGASFFTSLTVLIVAAASLGNPDTDVSLGSAAFLIGVCVLAGAVGVTLRGLMLRFGAASQALSETWSRLAVTQAVESERARLAREMHDSVAKTLHGLALAADGLADSADRVDPLTVKHQAELVARSARHAAAESRELLSDLRRESDLDGGVHITEELAARTADFARRTGLPATFRLLGNTPVPPVPHAVARQALTIAAEGMENAHRHAEPSHLDVSAGIVDDQLRISVYDNGRGLPPGTSLEQLKRAGHFGLVGMVERAAGIGARIRIGKGRATRGTEVRLDLPLAALLPAHPGTYEQHSTPSAPRGATAGAPSTTAAAPGDLAEHPGNSPDRT